MTRRITLSAPVAFAAQSLPYGCSTVRGQIVGTAVVEGKNPQGRFDETTTTQDDLKNFSPESQEGSAPRKGATGPARPRSALRAGSRTHQPFERAGAQRSAGPLYPPQSHRRPRH